MRSELSIVPQSNTTPTVSLVKTIVQIIAWVMNHINSLSAISGGCDCMSLEPSVAIFAIKPIFDTI